MLQKQLEKKQQKQQKQTHNLVKKPSQILRETTLPKNTGSFSDFHGEKYCAVGVLLRELYGWNGDSTDLKHVCNTYAKRLESMVGHNIFKEIERRNDHPFNESFSEIADFLESKGF